MWVLLTSGRQSEGGRNGDSSIQTVENTTPGILTVVAGNIDRSFPIPIILGNNRTIMSQAMSIGNHTGFASLAYLDDPYVEVLAIVYLYH